MSQTLGKSLSRTAGYAIGRTGKRDALEIAMPPIVTQTVTGEALTIRAATVKDAATLGAIGAKSFATTHQAALSNEELTHAVTATWSEEQVARAIADPNVQTLVAEIDQRVVGLLSLNPAARPNYVRRINAVEVGRFYVHPDWIGCGIGSQLIVQALRRAAADGYDICWLRVWQGNKAAIHFYRRWGFTTIAADYYPVGNTTVPVWVMIHALSGKADSRAMQ